MQRTGAEIIIDVLEAEAVPFIAGMPGGANLPLYDALARSRLRHVLVRHEQSAGFIAQGIARVTGKPGVCFATSGPGATNLVTALADARMDSIPLVAITGQVPTALIGTDAFQEVDSVAMCKPVVKHAVMVEHVSQLRAALQSAFEHARAGRPGPVLVDVPKDVQQARCEDADRLSGAPPAQQPQAAASITPTQQQLASTLAFLVAARRPIVYAGGGVIQSGASAVLAQFARRQQLPVTCTLMGLGCFEPADTLNLGMLGMHAAPYTNMLLSECDLLFAIGARFDDRATGKLREFCPHARVVHIDIDARQIGKLRKVELGVQCDARAFLEALLPLTPVMQRPDWLARLHTLRARFPLPSGDDPRAAPALLRHIGSCVPKDTIITTDVGQHQMWVAQHLPILGPRQLLTSGGLGSMGFGLPAAIGAALASSARVLCVTGDGSLLLNIQELSTLVEHDLDVTIIVFDNRHLGLVRQQQMLFYERRLSAAKFERPTDFVAVARAFGVPAATYRPGREPARVLDALLERRGPSLVHIPLDEAQLVLPMVPPGAANHDMVGLQPSADLTALDSTR